MTPRVTLSMGMGIDSAALLTRWLLESETRMVPDPATGDLVPFDLADLVVVTAMTGDEYFATGFAMELHLLPLMARHGVRYVQVARAGQSDTDGIAVLSDSRATARMHMRGPWRLADELRAAGTVPQVASGKRLCSFRAKGWVLDRWAEAEYAGADRVHVIGFAAEETGRAKRDTSYTQEARTPDYPLIRWGWDREQCAAYLLDVYGLDWPRSCCGYCPFQAGPELFLLATRWAADTDACVQALKLEAIALALNPRMALFGSRTARDVATSFGLHAAVATADAELASTKHALYEVRRVFRRAGDTRDGAGWALGPDSSAKGQTWRSLRRVRTAGGWPIVGTAARLGAHLATRARRGGELEHVGTTTRLWFERAAAPWPATERYLVVAPAGIADKERTAFDELWTYARALNLPRQGQLFGSLQDGQVAGAVDLAALLAELDALGV